MPSSIAPTRPLRTLAIAIAIGALLWPAAFTQARLIPDVPVAAVPAATRAAGLPALAHAARQTLAQIDPSPRAVVPATAENDYPAADSKYHSYPEMIAAINHLAALHPDIVRISSIGTSARGRDIPVVKISDNPDVDESEPEVLFDAEHHAREHLTPEMALSIIHLLVDGYGTAGHARTTAIVDSRVIWVVPMVNPDGLEWDLGGRPYRLWRKNRQSNGPGQPVGTDLNRNYGWHWGEGGASTNPADEVYQGSAPFSAPETAAIRDFILSRVVNGRQRITAYITFHTFGQLILYPYGDIRDTSSPDMTTADLQAFSAMAHAMAATNGYTAEQGLDLYVTTGTSDDWAYATQRIFGFTFEMYPADGPFITAEQGFYPADEVIRTQTQRNHEAVLYLLENADCPYRAIGKAAEDCGPLYDDLEIDRGWTVNAAGTDTATGGTWQRGDPAATSQSGPKQLGTASSGRDDLSTGRRSLGCATCNDVDGGTTTVRSALVALPASQGATLSLRYYLGHDAGADAADGFRVAVIHGGTRSVVLNVPATPGTDRDAAWTDLSVDISAWAGQSIAVQFEATDAGSDDLVEAGVDDVRITSN